MNTCPACDAMVDVHDKFCQRCGHRLTPPLGADDRAAIESSTTVESTPSPGSSTDRRPHRASGDTDGPIDIPVDVPPAPPVTADLGNLVDTSSDPPAVQDEHAPSDTNNERIEKPTKPVLVLRRSVAMSTLLGLGLSESTLSLEGGALHYKGVEYRSVFFNYRRVTRTIYLRDIESIGETLSVHPILLILAALGGINVVACVSSGLNLWWQLPLWKLPYGWLLAEVLRSFGLTNDQWLIAHLVTVVLYLVLYLLFRRTFFLFEAADPSHIYFRVDGISAKTRGSFRAHCLESWKKVKLGDQLQREAAAPPPLRADSMEPSATSAVPHGFRCAICSERYAERSQAVTHIAARHHLSGNAIDANIIAEASRSES
jgi:hypothetical protein